jgi:DNA-directed RNA polymerase subunit RPC12/RpoP
MRKLFNGTIVVSLVFFAFKSEKHTTDKQEEYVCIPCGSDCDSTVHKGPGKCGHCGMDLVRKSTIKHKDIQPADLCSFIAKM